MTLDQWLSTTTLTPKLVQGTILDPALESTLMVGLELTELAAIPDRLHVGKLQFLEDYKVSLYKGGCAWLTPRGTARGAGPMAGATIPGDAKPDPLNPPLNLVEAMEICVGLQNRLWPHEVQSRIAIEIVLKAAQTYLDNLTTRER